MGVPSLSRDTWILSGLAIALVGVGVWLHGDAGETAGVPPALLPDLRGEEITQVRIHEGASEIVLARGEGGWRLVRPLGVGADDDAVVELLRHLRGARRQEVVGASPALAASVGLQPATRQLTVQRRDGTVVGLALGSRNNFDGRVYARVLGEATLLLTDEALVYQLSRTLFQWRDKRLLVLDGEEVAALRIAPGAGTAVSARRRDGGVWIGAAPGYAGDRELFARGVDMIANLRARRFLREASASTWREALASVAASSPEWIIELSAASGASLATVVLARGASDEVVATGDGLPVVEVAAATPAQWAAWLAALQRRVVVDLDVAAVSRVEVDDGGRRFALIRAGEHHRWHLAMAAAPQRLAKASEVLAFLLRIQRLRSGTVGDAEKGMTRLRRRVTLHRRGTSAPVVLEIGEAVAAGHPLRVAPAGPILWVEHPQATPLLVPPQSFVGDE